VAIVERDAQRQAPTYRAINSCIALLPMVAGREVVTVEGIGTRAALHPVQRRWWSTTARSAATARRAS
jgi:xanthine dehydrogenase large subunit